MRSKHLLNMKDIMIENTYSHLVYCSRLIHEKVIHKDPWDDNFWHSLQLDPQYHNIEYHVIIVFVDISLNASNNNLKHLLLKITNYKFLIIL